MDSSAQQHTVDAYRFELGNVANLSVVQSFINIQLNAIDNCLARRVAYGVGATMPAIQQTRTSPTYPTLYELASQGTQNKSNAGLSVAVLATDTTLATTDVEAITPLLQNQQVSLTIVASRIGSLQSGVNASQSFITSSSVFYDAVLIGTSNATSLIDDAATFLMQAYKHGKPIGALGGNGDALLTSLGIGGTNDSMGVFSGSAASVTSQVLTALSYPSRFFGRFPIDDLEEICGNGVTGNTTV
jgi:catalase